MVTQDHENPTSHAVLFQLAVITEHENPDKVDNLEAEAVAPNLARSP